MTTEDIINQIGELLGDFKFDEANEETKMGALNIANEVLYPLKESKKIQDYQFTAKIIDSSIELSIFVKETEQDETSQWDLTLQKDG